MNASGASVRHQQRNLHDRLLLTNPLRLAREEAGFWRGPRAARDGGEFRTYYCAVDGRGVEAARTALYQSWNGWLKGLKDAGLSGLNGVNKTGKGLFFPGFIYLNLFTKLTIYFRNDIHIPHENSVVSKDKIRPNFLLYIFRIFSITF